jgi:hypothetical protein
MSMVRFNPRRNEPGTGYPYRIGSFISRDIVLSCGAALRKAPRSRRLATTEPRPTHMDARRRMLPISFLLALLIGDVLAGGDLVEGAPFASSRMR